MTLNKQQKGFTIVELLIVIVVIGILAALVITTFSGIQQRARDTERQSDINAMRSQLEAFYADNGYYPSNGEFVDATFRSNNNITLETEALYAPNQTTVPGEGASSITVYQYLPIDSATSAACANPAPATCSSYTLDAALEGGGNFTKTSLN